MKRSNIIAIIVVIVIVVIAGVYFGTMNNNTNRGGNAGGGGGNTPVVENPVSISNFAFSPNLITIHVGENVTWKNNDGTAHTVTSDGNSSIAFNSGTLNSGSTYVFKFTQAGDFWYHCTIHSFMAHAHVRVLASM
jgi:plastocyanin